MLKQINSKIAKEWLDKNECCIIDVRELSEHQNQSIKGSHLIPLGQLAADKIPQQFKNKKIVVHCQRGGRSTKACNQLLQENPNLEIYNLEGGILGWNECGLETACATDKKKCTMSLERQVRLTAGILVFLGCFLAIIVDPIFIALPTFVGFGLAFTAIIDWCGMAKVLSVMPWNK